MRGWPSGLASSLAGGCAVVVVMVLGAGLWAASVEIAGAVLADGVVAVASSVKRVQHPSGGIVGALLVQNGDHVKAGDVLLRLDETQTRAALDAVVRQLDALELSKARLVAERDEAKAVQLPPRYGAAGLSAQDQEMAEAEVRLFESRKAAQDDKRAEIRSRIAQLKLEAAAVDEQIRAKEREIALVEQEIEARRKLNERERATSPLEIRQVEVMDLLTEQRILALRRDAARLEGELVQLRAQAQQLAARRESDEQMIARITSDAKRAALAELAEVQGRIRELDERRLAAQDQLSRLDLRSPETGIVHELSVPGAGAVIAAGEVLMMIVPFNDALVVEARIEPRDIDQVLGASDVEVRFVAFDVRSTPVLKAKLARVSADLARDSRTGATFFVARVEIGDEELKRLGDKKLVPGMPAEVQIITADRTALAYLLKPLQDQIARAWRER